MSELAEQIETNSKIKLLYYRDINSYYMSLEEYNRIINKITKTKNSIKQRLNVFDAGGATSAL
ncbi:MAG: hypothetical protein F6K55_09710 [Moorea sp. SIO4A3]|nr:hypothetical protein [Moorena sp. SIO4A3]